MNQDDAWNAFAQLKESLFAKIPTDAPAKGRRYLGYLLDEQLAAARMHLAAIYQHDLEIGPGFTAIERCQSHPKYAFWTEGIRRHIQLCETSLRGEEAG